MTDRPIDLAPVTAVADPAALLDGIADTVARRIAKHGTATLSIPADRPRDHPALTILERLTRRHVASDRRHVANARHDVAAGAVLVTLTRIRSCPPT